MAKILRDFLAVLCVNIELVNSYKLGKCKLIIAVILFLNLCYV